MTQAQRDIRQNSIKLRLISLHTMFLIIFPFSSLKLLIRQTLILPIPLNKRNIPLLQKFTLLLIKQMKRHHLQKNATKSLKDPLFLSPPVPPTILSKPSLSTNRDDHLIPLLSQDIFIFKAELTSLYMHPTDYTFHLYDKNQEFFISIDSKLMSPYQN